MNASTSHRTRRTTRRISPDIWVWILIVTALTLIMGFDPSRELPLPMTLANGALVVAWSIVWAGVRRRWLPAALLWATITLVLFVPLASGRSSSR